MKLSILFLTTLIFISSAIGMEEGNTPNKGSNNSTREMGRIAKPSQEIVRLITDGGANLLKKNREKEQSTNNKNDQEITGRAGKEEVADDGMEEENSKRVEKRSMQSRPSEQENNRSSAKKLRVNNNNNNDVIRLADTPKNGEKAAGRLKRLVQFVEQFKNKGKDPIFTIADLAAKNEELRKRNEQYNLNQLPNDIIKSEIIRWVITSCTRWPDYKKMIRTMQALSCVSRRFKTCICSPEIQVLLKTTAHNFVKDIASKNNMLQMDVFFMHDVIEAAEYYLLTNKKNGQVGYRNMDLLKAAEFNAYRIAKVLLDNGVDINVQDSNRDTALMLAIKHGSLTVARLLINRGADVNHISRGGASYIVKKTALILAVEKNDLEMARLLLEKGADVNTGYQAPFFVTTNDKMKELLKQYGAKQ